MSDLFWLSKKQLNRMMQYFPLAHGVPRVDDLRVISGVIHVIKRDSQWRNAPLEYGPHKLIRLSLAFAVFIVFTFLPALAFATEQIKARANGRLICSERVQPSGPSKIISFASDGADQRVLIADGVNLLPSVSRSGKTVLFSKQMGGAIEIFEMNIDGKDIKQLTHNTSGGNLKPVFSPDESLIAFMGIRPSIGHPEVWMMNRDGSHLRQLTKTSAVPNQKIVRGKPHIGSGQPSFSADGKTLYFASTSSGSVQIWVMRLDASNKRRLTDGMGGNYPQANVPNVSLSGEKVAFWSGFEGQYGEIWLMNFDGSSPEMLTETKDPGNSDDPVISPDGKQIVFGRGVRGDRAMHLLDIETKGVNLLATGVQYCAWQPLPINP